MNPEFDADGNQTLLKTATGIWHVLYNAENRPILFSNATTVVEMAYDYMGRRFEYKETVSGTLTRHERYFYRGYLQIVALDMLNSASVKHTIAWDPSEPTATRPLSLQIGANAFYYSFDQIKNVSEIFDSTGAVAATYDYSPFGQITSALSVGSSAFDVSSNPLTFSSEIHDFTLGLQYYNYRHLNVLDGRWVNRDPIGERGGVNVYGLCKNNVFMKVDFLGRSDCCDECNESKITGFTISFVPDLRDRKAIIDKGFDLLQVLLQYDNVEDASEIAGAIGERCVDGLGKGATKFLASGGIIVSAAKVLVENYIKNDVFMLVRAGVNVIEKHHNAAYGQLGYKVKINITYQPCVEARRFWVFGKKYRKFGKDKEIIKEYKRPTDNIMEGDFSDGFLLPAESELLNECMGGFLSDGVDSVPK
jgi:RHS repeat-associated protein